MALPGPVHARAGEQDPRICDILPSAAGALGAPGFTDVLGIGSADVVVVVLVDGLGIHALRRNPDLAPFLTAADAVERRVAQVRTSFPATTVSAIASLGTGVLPGEHGIVGTAFHLDGHHGMFLPLHWRESPNPVATQPLPTVFEQVERVGVDTYAISPRNHADSGFTRASLRGAAYMAADTVGQRVSEVVASTRRPPALVYVYWPDLDKSGHVNGPESAAWNEDLRVVDLLCERIAAVMPERSALVVTADHGMIDTPPERAIDIDAESALWADLVQLGGEPRARHIYTTRKAAAHVKGTWQQVLGDRAEVVLREEAVEAGWFGETDPWHLDRIGHVLAVAKGDWAMVSPKVDGMLARLRGQHGAFESEEVDVPLVVHRT